MFATQVCTDETCTFSSGCWTMSLAQISKHENPLHWIQIVDPLMMECDVISYTNKVQSFALMIVCWSLLTFFLCFLSFWEFLFYLLDQSKLHPCSVKNADARRWCCCYSNIWLSNHFYLNYTEIRFADQWFVMNCIVVQVLIYICINSLYFLILSISFFHTSLEDVNAQRRLLEHSRSQV